MVEQMPESIGAERLLLRRVRPGDELGVYGLLSNARVVRYMLFPVFTREKAKQFVTRLQAPPKDSAPREEVYGIEVGEPPALRGLCGLVIESTQPVAELWYLLDPDFWGAGYAAEAAGALVAGAFDHLSLHRIWASCLPENPASARVLEKLGFRREGTHRKNLRVHGEWRDSHTYAMLGAEWQAGP